MSYDGDKTPDLSKEFHPMPKVFKAKKPRKGLNPIGKKGQNSLDAVSELKKIFEAWGITSCEWEHAGCWYKNSLTFAHKDKRRFISMEDIRNPRFVALICTPGHQILEAMPRDEMREIIEDIVEKREARI